MDWFTKAWRALPSELTKAAEVQQQNAMEADDREGMVREYLDKKEAAAAALRDYDNMLTRQDEDAEVYRRWFLPTWEGVAPEGRQILKAYFIDSRTSQRTVDELMVKLGLNHRAFHLEKDRLLRKLALLLYGY